MQQIDTNELSSLAYKKVRSMIIDKKLVPGKKIIQDKLAENLGISRTPLRAALQRLEGENLVVSIPRRGMIVKEFSDQEIVEIYDCRIALECTAVGLYTLRASEHEIEKLKSLFKPFLQGEININKYQKIDSEFHDTILKNCGNKMLYQIYSQANLLVCIDMIGLVRPPQETLGEHLEIINAIQNKDKNAAEEYAKQHLLKSKQLILNNMND